MLFWETRLSENNAMSCGTCHLPEVSFAEPEPYSTGVTGAIGTRNAMALINMGWASSYFWDGRALTLEEQIFEPIPHPDEMNLPWSEAVARLANDDTESDYPQRFFDAFGTTEITADLVSKAIAQFVRTMISSDSKFDQWRRGEASLTDSEYNGYQMRSRSRARRSIRGRLLSLPRGSRASIHGPSVPQQRTRPEFRGRSRAGFGHRKPPGFRTFPHPDVAQRGPLRPLHARRPVPNPGGGCRTLQLRRGGVFNNRSFHEVWVGGVGLGAVPKSGPHCLPPHIDGHGVHAESCVSEPPLM